MEATAVSRKLHRIIAEKIRGEGPIPFARFMEFCLYHPEYGYYASGRGRRGRAGDYVTSPTIHPIFGALLAKQMAQMWRIMGAGTFEVVEMGGGEGYLCKDIMDYLEREEPQFYDQFQYRMVEISPAILERQKGLLSTHQGKITWQLFDEMGNRKVQGCFLSNELVDSFPVHRVAFEGEALQEVYVDLDQEGGFIEVHGDPSTPELAEYFRRVGVTLADGQHAEVNLEALRWLKGVAEGLALGFVITVDYGYSAEELYSPLRREGTFLCYQGHKALANPYANVGLQDMTAHVDFTSLIVWGEGYGLHLAGMVPQYRFLLSLGILEQAAQAGEGKGEWEALNERLTIKNLILPGGMGQGFKVLIQHKGVDTPQLNGLRGCRN
jgi:SAM-dependent MidA family methyltransferase